MSTKLTPLHSRVIIKRVTADDKTEGGLFIPESAKEKPRRGEVRHVSEDAKLKVGDIVLFGKYAGVELIVDAEELLVMKEEDVIAKVDEA